MSDPVTPTAAPAAAPAGAKPAKPSPKEGALGNAWGYAILFIVLVASGVLGEIGSQLGFFFRAIGDGITGFIWSIFQVIKMNMTAILIVLATVWAIKAMKK